MLFLYANRDCGQYWTSLTYCAHWTVLTGELLLSGVFLFFTGWLNDSSNGNWKRSFLTDISVCFFGFVYFFHGSLSMVWLFSSPYVLFLKHSNIQGVRIREKNNQQLMVSGLWCTTGGYDGLCCARPWLYIWQEKKPHGIALTKGHNEADGYALTLQTAACQEDDATGAKRCPCWIQASLRCLDFILHVKPHCQSPTCLFPPHGSLFLFSFPPYCATSKGSNSPNIKAM